MNRILYYALLLAVISIAPVSGIAEEILSSAKVFAAYETVRPGDELPLAVRITVAEGWHTYAQEPGDSGMPPSIQVKGPDGIETSTWQFPSPQTFTDSAGTTYGYEKEVVLRGKVHIPETFPPGTSVELTASMKWMICKDICVFMKDTAVITIQTGEVSPELSSEWKLLTAESKKGN